MIYRKNNLRFTCTKNLPKFMVVFTKKTNNKIFRHGKNKLTASEAESL